MEDKDLLKLLRQYMPAEQTATPAPDPLLVIEARLTVGSRKEKKQQNRAAAVVKLARRAMRPLAAAAMLLLTLSVLMPQNRSGKENGSTMLDDQANITAAMRNTTLSVISSTMLTSIPTLRN